MNRSKIFIYISVIFIIIAFGQYQKLQLKTKIEPVAPLKVEVTPVAATATNTAPEAQEKVDAPPSQEEVQEVVEQTETIQPVKEKTAQKDLVNTPPPVIVNHVSTNSETIAQPINNVVVETYTPSKPKVVELPELELFMPEKSNLTKEEKIIEIRALSEYYKKHKEVIKEYKEEIKKHKEKIRKLIREYKEKIKELIKEHKELSEYHIELIESHDKKHMELYDLLSRAKMSDDGVYINFKDDAQLYSSETREKLLEKLYKKITKKEKNRNKMLNKVSNNKIMKKINKFRLNILEKDIFYNRSKVIEIEKLNAVYQLEIFYYLYELEQLYYLIYKETSSCSLYNYKGNVESYHNRISYMRGFA